jgi:transposase InsO family protein
MKYKDMVPVRWLCNWTGIAPSTWYYMPTDGRRGAKPSTHTYRLDGERVSNTLVTEEIKNILSEEFICYGYEKTTWELQDRGYIVNKKKVYRLMDEAHLLLRHNRIATQGKRQFVQARRIDAAYPLQYLVMDIKYVWIQGEKRNAYLLTVMDVFSRKVLAHSCKLSIRQSDVILLLDGIVQNYQTKGLIIRNDNGSQFLAHSVRKYLKSKQISQEFTHVATPEENAYIEALHSVLEKELIRRYWFDSIHYGDSGHVDHPIPVYVDQSF